jgi:hypothetical protein
MKKTLSDLRCNGEPVYEEWTNNGTVLEFTTRETKKLPDGSWKFVRSISLHKVKIDGRLALKRRLNAAHLARQHLLAFPGMRAV